MNITLRVKLHNYFALELIPLSNYLQQRVKA